MGRSAADGVHGHGLGLLGVIARHIGHAHGDVVPAFGNLEAVAAAAVLEAAVIDAVAPAGTGFRCGHDDPAIAGDAIDAADAGVLLQADVGSEDGIDGVQREGQFAAHGLVAGSIGLLDADLSEAIRAAGFQAGDYHGVQACADLNPFTAILDVLDGDVLEVGVRIGQLQDGNGHGGTPYKVTSRYLRHARLHRTTQAPNRTRDVPDDQAPDRREKRGDLVGRKPCSVTNACHSDGAHLS